MISQFALNKALLDKLNSITVLDIAAQGSAFTPSPGDDYIAEKEVPTNTEITLGIGKDTQRGFYQITIATPIAKKKFYHLQKIDELMPLIGKGLAAGVEFNGQKVSISTITPSGMYSDDTHLKTALTIAYTVIA